MRKVCLLGASGSIGTQSLDVLRNDAGHFRLVGFSVGHQVQKIPSILHDFPSVKFLCVQEEKDYERYSRSYPNLHWYYGEEGLLCLIRECGCDMVVNALVGFAGLAPSLCSLGENKILCLANKESLVVGGDLIRDLIAQGKGKIYPIDSEHVAIAKLLSRVQREDVDEIWITGSGGSFRTKKREELTNVTPEEALHHPTWNMGAKITIDSATMMNKGFEVLEAKVLFDFPLEKTKIILHDESHVHSLLRLKDGTLLADVSEPDMHGPIAYALYESNVNFSLEHVGSLEELRPYHFHPFDAERYPAPGIALRAFEKGGTSRAVLNGANEAAVYAFLAHRIPFLSIEKLVKQAVDVLPCTAHPTYLEMQEADKASRAFVEQQIGG